MAIAKGKPAMARINGSVPSTSATASPAPAPPSRPSPYAARHKIADHFIGGNRLENAVAGPVKDFVMSHDGHTVITHVSKGKGVKRETTRSPSHPLPEQAYRLTVPGSIDSDCQ